MWKEWQDFWVGVEEWWSNLISLVRVKMGVTMIEKKEWKDQGTQTEQIKKERFSLFEKIKWKF